MVATLSTCMKDVPCMLLLYLEEEFNSLINKKDQMNIETKIRNIRFIGELCKFKIAPAGLLFSCLKQDVLDPPEDCQYMALLLIFMTRDGRWVKKDWTDLANEGRKL